MSADFPPLTASHLSPNSRPLSPIPNKADRPISVRHATYQATSKTNQVPFTASPPSAANTETNQVIIPDLYRPSPSSATHQHAIPGFASPRLPQGNKTSLQRRFHLTQPSLLKQTKSPPQICLTTIVTCRFRGSTATAAENAYRGSADERPLCATWAIIALA